MQLTVGLRHVLQEGRVVQLVFTKTELVKVVVSTLSLFQARNPGHEVLMLSHSLLRLKDELPLMVWRPPSMMRHP
jgi:hypothetical protein